MRFLGAAAHVVARIARAGPNGLLRVPAMSYSGSRHSVMEVVISAMLCSSYCRTQCSLAFMPLRIASLWAACRSRYFSFDKFMLIYQCSRMRIICDCIATARLTVMSRPGYSTMLTNHIASLGNQLTFFALHQVFQCCAMLYFMTPCPAK